MSVGQVDIEALERFQLATGMGRLYGPYHEPSRSGRPMTYLRVTRIDDILRLYQLLRPFLGRVKRTQFEEALTKFFELRPAESDGRFSSFERRQQIQWARLAFTQLIKEGAS